MIRRSLTIVFAACCFAAAIPGAIAQSAFDSTADTGDFGNNTDFSRQGGGQVIHNNSAYDRSRGLGSVWGDTRTTNTGNYLGNSGGLAPTTTGLTAPNSVNNAPIPSGSFDLGFGPGSSQPFTGPYNAGPYGGLLPPTATSSVDIDVSNLSNKGGFNIQKPNEFRDMLKNENIPSTFNEQGGTDNPMTGF